MPHERKRFESQAVAALSSLIFCRLYIRLDKYRADDERQRDGPEAEKATGVILWNSELRIDGSASEEN